MHARLPVFVSVFRQRKGEIDRANWDGGKGGGGRGVLVLRLESQV